MIRITFLGTSGSVPTKDKSLPGLALEYNGETFIFDCGEGTQRQMMKYKLNMSKIKAIFLTHIHGDHSIGVAGLVRTMSLMKRTTPLQIFVPKGDEKQIAPLMNFDRATLNYDIEIKPVQAGTVYKGKGFSIEAFRLIHPVSTFGFAFKEQDKVHFMKEKARAAGLKGTMFSEMLKKGKLKVKNRVINLKEITTLERGKKVVYATDTRPSKNTINAAKDADLLIHEATYATTEQKLAKERSHSTATEAAQIAKSAKPKRLLLLHISTRYRDGSIIVNEARKTFKNTEAAKDGMQVNV
ncbi:MAG: ribonuclease Z [Candidatus Micrarchaeota archaeon]|nr:ribonuclease Z [Candidatus Micrarchaeota archaeon]